MMAPSVVLDPGATGKVKVLESLNDVGPHGVRGCLRLADLKDMGGNAEAFLMERGLKPMSLDGAGASADAKDADIMVTTRPLPIHANTVRMVLSLSFWKRLPASCWAAWRRDGGAPQVLQDPPDVREITPWTSVQQLASHRVAPLQPAWNSRQPCCLGRRACSNPRSSLHRG